MQQLRYRIKDAQLIRVDNQMTVVCVSPSFRSSNFTSPDPYPECYERFPRRTARTPLRLLRRARCVRVTPLQHHERTIWLVVPASQ
jgi:hypothetical protein